MKVRIYYIKRYPKHINIPTIKVITMSKTFEGVLRLINIKKIVKEMANAPVTNGKLKPDSKNPLIFLKNFT